MVIRGKNIEFKKPAVMGILNITPDSFYVASRAQTISEIQRLADQMINDGADIIDIGACSTRPNSQPASIEEEYDRLSLAVKSIRQINANIPVSIDTFRAKIAEIAVADWGADIINDISGGEADPDMSSTVARLHVPYILTHNTKEKLESDSNNLIPNMLAWLAERIQRLHLLGVTDIIVDPGFGFGKSIQDNYTVLRNLRVFRDLGCPILVGLSRKSMLTSLLNIKTEESLNATTAANVIALCGGASFLRVHDVKAAREAITVYNALNF